MNGDSPVLLEMRDISIQFGVVKALDKAQLTVRSGEIHTIMGENGAGKSTILKILTGVYKPDAGEIRLEGKIIAPKSPSDAQRLGVSMVYQEVNLIPYLSVAENICLGRKSTIPGFISYRSMKKRAEAALARMGLNIDTGKPVASYSIAIQQMVAIARALDVDAKVLVLDEPTSSLDPGEVRRLYEVMRRLRSEGMGLIFVTHFLDQVYEVSDRLTVLRNGKYIGTWDASELSRDALVAEMLGRQLKNIEEIEQEAQENRQQIPSSEKQQVLLEARDAGRKGSAEKLNFQMRSGQTTGLAGLLGSGRTETGRLIFGADKSTHGQWLYMGRPIKLNTPRQAMKLGFGFCSEDRKTEGIIPELSVRENIALALQARRGWWKPISLRRQRAMADEYIKALRIATPDGEKAIRYLSGGNQQKVILARWLVANPKLLILDEPTRGIDVGAKAEIEALVTRLRNGGMSVLFISSELDETLRVSEELIVMRDRKQAEILRGDDINESRVMKGMAGSAH